MNSYKRYQPDSWAPTAVAWGHDNRTTGFRGVGHGARTTASSAASPAPTCNPYLAFAATIAAGLAGIEHGVEPPAALRGQRLHRRATWRGSRTSLVDAIAALESSAIAADAFGDDVHHHLVNTARAGVAGVRHASSPTGSGAAASSNSESLRAEAKESSFGVRQAA